MHQIYDVVLHADENDEENEAWITELEQKYDDVREMVLSHKALLKDLNVT